MPKKNEEILIARIFSLVPAVRFLSAAAISQLFEERFREPISTAKVSRILAVLAQEGLIEKKEKKRSFGAVFAYALIKRKID